MLSSAYATNIGGLTILGMQGWRFAFLTVAVISAVAGIAMWVAAKDPRCSRNTWQLDLHYRHKESGSSSDRRAAGSNSSEHHQHRTTHMTDSSASDTAGYSRDQQSRRDVSRHKTATGLAAAVGRESESHSLLRGGSAGPAGMVARLQQFLRSALASEMWVVLSTPSFLVVVVQVSERRASSNSNQHQSVYLCLDPCLGASAPDKYVFVTC